MKDLFKRIKPYLPYVIALLARGLLPFGLAPYTSDIAPIVPITVLIGCIAKVKWKQAALLGLCFGLGMFGVGASWIYASIHDYGYAAPWLAATITGGFVLISPLFPALQMGSLVKLFPSNNATRACIVFPAWWVIFEIFRGWFLTGFPWLYVGYTQLENRLSAYAPVGGVFLVSFFTVLICGALYSLVDYYYTFQKKPRLRNSLIAVIVGIWVLAYGLHKVTFTYPSGKGLSVALVQGNIPQLLRWDPQAVSNIIRSYRSSSMEISNVDLIVWPESAIPLPLPLSRMLFTELNTTLQSRHIGLIAGVPSQAGDSGYYFNSLVGVGDASGVYDKKHLVPFGEYVPFERQLRGVVGFFDLPMSAFIPGEPSQQPLMLGNIRFAPAICYEIAYPFYVQSMSKGADVILTVSNDTWFGHTIGPAQHMQIAQCRALENGKPLIRATNTGITALVNYQGKITAIAPQFEATVLKGNIELREGQTPWTRFGPWPLFVFLTGLVGFAFLMRGKKKA